MTIVTQPVGPAVLVDERGQATPELQTFFDDITLASGVKQLEVFEVANLPNASPSGRFLFVTDEVGGVVPAFSDGSNWRRCTDRTIVSS